MIDVDDLGMDTVTTEDEVLKLTNKGYDCQIIRENTWLMKRLRKVKSNFHQTYLTIEKPNLGPTLC